jgi:hypothetical protein
MIYWWIYWIYHDVGFLILWQAKTSLTVLQTAVLAHPMMSSSANDDGNPNTRSPTDDPAAPAAKRYKGKGERANHRQPDAPRASSSRRTKCVTSMPSICTTGSGRPHGGYRQPRGTVL